MMLFIHGFSGRSGEQQLSTNHVQSMTSSNPDHRSTKINADYDDDNESCCSHCGNDRKKRKRRGISCGTLLFLLAIDAFTIALLLILFYNIKSYSGAILLNDNTDENQESIPKNWFLLVNANSSIFKYLAWRMNCRHNLFITNFQV